MIQSSCELRCDTFRTADSSCTEIFSLSLFLRSGCLMSLFLRRRTKTGKSVLKYHLLETVTVSVSRHTDTPALTIVLQLPDIHQTFNIIYLSYFVELLSYSSAFFFNFIKNQRISLNRVYESWPKCPPYLTISKLKKTKVLLFSFYHFCLSSFNWRYLVIIS